MFTKVATAACLAAFLPLFLLSDEAKTPTDVQQAQPSVIQPTNSSENAKGDFVHVMPRKLTLTEAKRIALRGNPDLEVTAARLRAAAARVRQAEASFYPSLDLTADGKRQINTAAQEKGIAHKDAYSVFSTQLQSSVPLYNETISAIMPSASWTGRSLT